MATSSSGDITMGMSSISFKGAKSKFTKNRPRLEIDLDDQRQYPHNIFRLCNRLRLENTTMSRHIRCHERCVQAVRESERNSPNAREAVRSIKEDLEFSSDDDVSDYSDLD